MVDSFTETTTQGWGSRIGDSIKGILFGIILFIVGFPLLGWNEHRAVIDFKAFKEGRGAVVQADGDIPDSIAVPVAREERLESTPGGSRRSSPGTG